MDKSMMALSGTGPLPKLVFELEFSSLHSLNIYLLYVASKDFSLLRMVKINLRHIF